MAKSQDHLVARWHEDCGFGERSLLAGTLPADGRYPSLMWDRGWLPLFLSFRELLMLRHSMIAVLALLFTAFSVLAADKEVKCTLVRVDLTKHTLVVRTEDGKQHHFDVDDATKFIGPRGGASDLGIKDDRLT